ncbi:hypothetical protein DET0093 [Dehalococcoides mccartyi 195]|uniref:Uncharacterized protein n=1 Tax=Dehalococcoides mccartyi (strain ATCC BAA-2266 / KCTC 15142 / 195) TaxID=243164 RepID=Q3ZAA5_DEHM1|nr:hypothetical protein DET0093 [Dehalococcoides mccartyi 195]
MGTYSLRRAGIYVCLPGPKILIDSNLSRLADCKEFFLGFTF